MPQVQDKVCQHIHSIACLFLRDLHCFNSYGHIATGLTYSRGQNDPFLQCCDTGYRAAGTRHDIQPCNIIQTQGQPVIVIHWCRIAIMEGTNFILMSRVWPNEEEIITGYPRDGAMGSSGGWRVRMFVYITTLLWREAFWLLILHCGTPEPPNLYC